MENSLRVVLYARVSTTNNGQDPELQLRELREYAARRGWTIAGEYVDNGVSVSKESGPQLNALMKAAKQRPFDTLLVWKLDRFGRSLKHLVTALADLHAMGVAFVSFKEGLDRAPNRPADVSHRWCYRGVRARTDSRARSCRYGSCSIQRTQARPTDRRR